MMLDTVGNISESIWKKLLFGILRTDDELHWQRCFLEADVFLESLTFR